MGSPSQSSVLEDPLSDFSLASLFPRTFNQCDVDPGPNLRYNDPLEAVGAHLKSMALKNPNRLLEQARSILDGGLESINVDNLENVRGKDPVGDVRGVNNANLQGDIENLKNARDEDTVGDLGGVNHENLQGRRPGLGTKRARFSLKPNPRISSQPVDNLEPYVDMDKLSDPEEFFLALEDQENAMKEWRRQSGKALMDLDQNVPHMAERRRRPGLSGNRKPAVYKHRYPLVSKVDDKTFLSSQETLSQDLCSPTQSDHCLQPEQSGQENAGKERPDDISNVLQAGEDKEDESDEIIGMLQKRFKPIEVNKSCLPELNSVLQSEFRTLGESLQDSQNKMPDLHDIVSAIGKETTLGCDNVERCSGHSLTSPRPPKSPYSSISLLKARLFQSRKENNPFSALDIDESPLEKADFSQDTHDLAARRPEKTVIDSVKMQNISSVVGMNIESVPATTGDNDTRETNLNLPVHESECNAVSKDTQDLAAAKFTSSESNKGDSMMPGVPSDFIEHTELGDDNVEHGERDINLKSPMDDKESDATNTMETAKDISKTLGVISDGVMHDELDDSIRRDQSPKPAAHAKESQVSMISGTALDTSPHVELDHDNMANDTRDGFVEDNPSDVFDDVVVSATEHIEPDGRVVDKDVQGNMEKSNLNKEQSTVNAVENLAKHGSSSDRDNLFTADAVGDLDHDRPSSSSARPLKKARKASSKMAEYKRSKAREAEHECPRAETGAAATRKLTRESKTFITRKSLAGCGTQWETGLRRSTRIRTRPLEYWKGERQLYARIHNSLITVVGAKYFSPGKDSGKVGLKVKSYVSDEFKEIVEQAALH